MNEKEREKCERQNSEVGSRAWPRLATGSDLTDELTITTLRARGLHDLEPELSREGAPDGAPDCGLNEPPLRH